MLRDHGDHICNRSGQNFEIRSWSATVTAAMATKETSAMAHIHFLDMHGSVRNRLCLQRTTRIREAHASDHPCFSSLFHPRPDAHADAAEQSPRCMTLLTVATSFAERGLGEVDPWFADRRPRTSSTQSAPRTTPSPHATFGQTC